MTFTPAGTFIWSAGPTAVIRSPVMSTTWFARFVPDLGSNMRPARIAMVGELAPDWDHINAGPTSTANIVSLRTVHNVTSDRIIISRGPCRQTPYQQSCLEYESGTTKPDLGTPAVLS